MAVGLWDEEGIINIVDRHLKRPQKEETDIHGRKVTKHHAKTRDRPILRAGAKGTPAETI